MSAIPTQHEPGAIECACAQFDANAFGRSLVVSGLLRDVDWKTAQAVSRQSEQTPLRTILDLGLMSEDDLARAIAESLGVGLWDHKNEQAAISGALPRAFQSRSGVLALEPASTESALALVLVDPADRFTVRSALSQLEASAPGGVEVRIGTHRDVQAFLALSAVDETTSETDPGGRLD